MKYEDSYYLYQTVVHESRHAFQYAAACGATIYGYKNAYKVSPDIALLWDKNISEYISYVPEKGNYYAYYTQPIEYDAHLYAGQKLFP